jgi:methionyl-tRNA synthetase
MTDRILVTSALPYVNGIKHIGNLAGSILPADVYARFLRLRGRDVLFVCGTDEHGTPAELAALEAGLPVAEYCARQHAAQAAIYRRLDISFDHFGRSSSPQNHALTQQLFLQLEANGFIEERVLRQIWSLADHRFLPDRYIIGTCPHCGGAAARGDQCDSCGRLLDPADLIAPQSALSGSTALETRDTRHLFLLQSKLVDKLSGWLDGKSDWDPLVLSLACGLLTQGLQDRCITRDLTWGVPVPKPGWEGKVFYVWFDAPIAYVALTQEWAAAAPERDWCDWWRPGPETRLVQFLGKDNVAFHALTFPATILGSGADIRLVDRIKGFSWLTWGDDKFSTSHRRGIFLDAALDELPSDWWRWWLTANAPETSDTRFTPALFAEGCNADLADGLGNLVSRVLSFAATRFDGRVPDQGEPGEAESRLACEANTIITTCAGHFEAIRLRRACQSLRALWSLCDRYFASQAPWSAIRSSRDRAACTVRTAVNLLRLAAVIASPVLPHTSARITAALGCVSSPRWPTHVDDWLRQPGGLPVNPPGPLFPRLPPDWTVAVASRYGLR